MDKSRGGEGCYALYGNVAPTDFLDTIGPDKRGWLQKTKESHRTPNAGLWVDLQGTCGFAMLRSLVFNIGMSLARNTRGCSGSGSCMCGIRF